VNPDRPPALADLITRLLSKDPDRRPQSARAVAEAVLAISGASPSKPSWPPVPPGAGNVKTTENQSRSARPGRVLLIGGGVLVALMAAGYFLVPARFWPRRGGGDRPAVGAEERPAQSTGAPVQGVTGNEVVLGMSAAFSGPSKELGRDMKLGMDTYFQSLNDEGGIAGRKIRLVALDDGYEPERALQNMKDLYERDKVFAVIGNVGTPTTEKALPYALQNQVLFFGAFTGANLLRQDPPDRYVFNYRASYAEETEATLKYLVEIKKVEPKQIAVFAQRDAFGDAGFMGAARALRKYGVDPEHLLRVGYSRNTLDVSEAAETILKRKDIKSVIMVAPYGPAARFIQKMRDGKFAGFLSNVSFVGSVALAEELLQLGPDYTTGIIVTQVVPSIESRSSLVLKFQDRLKRYYPSEHASFVALEGYIVATIFAEGLRRAGEDLTTDRLIDALESIHNDDLGIGTPITFGPSEHQGSHKVWATVLDKAGHYQILDLD
jgi:ABC-type branched-subunit amino acid transport system substrate-binding protein